MRGSDEKVYLGESRGFDAVSAVSETPCWGKGCRGAEERGANNSQGWRKTGTWMAGLIVGLFRYDRKVVKRERKKMTIIKLA